MHPRDDAAQPLERETRPSLSAASDQYSTAPAPEEVLASQYRHINAGDYGAAYDLFGEESQQLVSRAEYRAYFASAALILVLAKQAL